MIRSVKRQARKEEKSIALKPCFWRGGCSSQSVVVWKSESPRWYEDLWPAGRLYAESQTLKKIEMDRNGHQSGHRKNKKDQIKVSLPVSR